jgi:CubicO group peptidase (beta-lactamase class C family)
MSAYVESGGVPGLVTAISRHGQTHIDAVGTLAVGGTSPMRHDTIFRITSMTKPITAVATMMLIEDGLLHLDEPVTELLPELVDRRVLTRIDAALDDTVPATRAITLRDLLTFRLGLGIIFDAGGPYPIQHAISDLELVGFGPPNPSSRLDPDEWMRRLGTLPLMYQPGERWLYNTGSYVLGVLIARASGQPLETFFSTRIFQPLGMKDTGFRVPSNKLDRLASGYMHNPETDELDLIDGVEDSQWSRSPVFPDGGAGLVSTAEDYLAFGQMLLNKGTYRGERLLSAESIELMTTDQITSGQKAVSEFFPDFWNNRGWGFGVSMVTGPDDILPVPGRYGWDGGYGTWWTSDPTADMVTILLTQRAFGSSEWNIDRDCWIAAYQAIAD